MKLAILALGLLMTSGAISQENPEKKKVPGFNLDRLNPALEKKKGQYMAPSHPLLLNREKSLAERKIGDTKYGPVYALPQDNMPCIMPSIKVQNPMPNKGQDLLQNPIDPDIYLNKKKHETVPGTKEQKGESREQ